MMAAGAAWADIATLKNGIVYKGVIDKENSLVSIFDADYIKRVIVRDSKIAKIDLDPGPGQAVSFVIADQPLTVHAGEMPAAAVGIKAGTWDNLGRRSFRYFGPRGGKPVEMTQAIISLGPRVCKIRGVDGFWQGQVSTMTVPKTVVLAILAKIDQKIFSERLKVCRFLIQAEWYTEARVEVARLQKDFASDPDVADKTRNALELIQDSESRVLFADIEMRRAAQQPREVLARLRTFPTEGVSSDVLASVKDQIRKEDRQASSDKALADAVRKAADDAKLENKAPILEILEGLAEAPDATRGRLEGFEKGLADGAKPEALAAMAISGWASGAESAVADLKAALVLHSARGLIHDYLATPANADGVRSEKLAALQSLVIDGKPIPIAMFTEILRRLPPLSGGGQDVTPESPKLLRVRDDPNPDQPSEYAVYLPPEYSPFRSYPMIVALHANETPMQCVSWWKAEAARRGYIIVAPEYNLRDQKPDYRYTQSEIAAAVLVLRDALKRFAVDPDRVFLGGSLLGGNMALDFGLSHPDLFAGVASVSGMPAKFVWVTKNNSTRVPLFIALGDLAPGENDYFLTGFAKPLISANRDLTYVEHYRRGLEDLPEEASAILDWMGPRRRDPTPKAFEVVAAREGDDRYYGMVVKDFKPGFTKDPVSMDVLGKGLKPASLEMDSSQLSNLLRITTTGIRNLDVWVSPKLIDFEKRMEVRVNNKAYFRGLAKPDLAAFLEDVRIRGDRSQIFWLKVPANLGNPRG